MSNFKNSGIGIAGTRMKQMLDTEISRAQRGQMVAGDWETKTAGFTAEVGGAYILSGTFTMTGPPSPEVGDMFRVMIPTGSTITSDFTPIAYGAFVGTVVEADGQIIDFCYIDATVGWTADYWA